MTAIRNILAMLAVTVLAGCGGNASNSALPGNLPAVETVNGQDVPQILLDILARERKLDLSVPEQRAAALTELTDYILLDQEARKEGYAKDPQFAAEVELNRLQGNANATLGKFRSTAHVDESVLKTEYQQQIAKAGRVEYDFSQLLFKSEDDALKASGEAMTQPFNEVYDRWSKKALQARAFQRVRPSQLPKPLGNALIALKSGETNKIPIQTQYGWHVMHVSAISPFVPPSFEELKDSIRETLLSQLSEQRLTRLRDTAKVTTATPDSAEPAPAGAAVPVEEPADKSAN
ncbi:MAG TPA: peptidyl-prolyl cis-trans isomerase [Dokdonella sp.]|uniref:peptidylprolyl isomerase n=1 Tax=Dokdonella sp. TaxID=2291710 RepID=UPI002D7E59BD|nr:peptidyl-prolyl cis-trans isomerase [Dokdonella sp.]HET9033930.1 peptidyl-prolyl cis-trans isomerase [Dokdonella sp.]